MARARKARWKIRSGEERVAEYARALKNEDRPTWNPEKEQAMDENYRDVATVLAQLDEKVRKFCSENMIPGWQCVNYMRVARKAWSIASSGYMADYVREVTYLAHKYGISDAMLDALLEYCGLPSVTRVARGGAPAPAVP